MPLEFKGAPDWLLQEYVNRKTPYQEASIGLQTALSNYMTIDESKRRNMLAQQEIANRQETNRLAAEQVKQKGYEQFADSANPAFLPANVRTGIANPIQGPVTPEGQAPAEDPIVAYSKQLIQQTGGLGYKGLEADKTKATAEKEWAMADYYKTKPKAPAKTLDALLAQRVQDGELTLEEAIALKAKGTPSSNTKPPAGYRFNPDGSLSPIPGGPADKKETEEDEKLKSTLDLYETARDGLLSGLEGSVTGPFAGRMPAVTEAQQTAEGGVAAMAPVLKQLFRVSGEGVFTDRDQALLLDMVPKRTDHPEARRKKMENIDAIVKAKLGMGGKSAPVQTGAPQVGEVRKGFRFKGGNPSDRNAWEKIP